MLTHLRGIDRLMGKAPNCYCGGKAERVPMQLHRLATKPANGRPERLELPGGREGRPTPRQEDPRADDPRGMQPQGDHSPGVEPVPGQGDMRELRQGDEVDPQDGGAEDKEGWQGDAKLFHDDTKPGILIEGTTGDAVRPVPTIHEVARGAEPEPKALRRVKNALIKSENFWRLMSEILPYPLAQATVSAQDCVVQSGSRRG